MCFGGGPSYNPPPPPPLAPPPPPPAPPQAPLPEPTPVETDINPQVRENKTRKTRNEMSRGTSELRIPLDSGVNAAGAAPGAGGGVNV
tara:strand:- start:1112 stop:1375 length:264 start_codon:yes stop_codon:yes gene_type:complete